MNTYIHTSIHPYTRGGLVEELDEGAADEGDGDGEAALHAAGVGARLLVDDMQQIYLAKALMNRCSQRLSGEVFQTAVKGQVFARRQGLLQHCIEAQHDRCQHALQHLRGSIMHN